MYTKRFNEWNTLKKKIEESTSTPYCHEGELWWMHAGENIGMEICGKGDGFARPVYILGVIGKKLALVVPITSVPHPGRHFRKISFKGTDQYLCFSQVKVISTKRLQTYMGVINEKTQQEIRAMFREIYG